jgi:hypothetical protein
MPASFRPVVPHPYAWVGYASDLTGRIRALGGRGLSRDHIVEELRLLVDEGVAVLGLLAERPMGERGSFDELQGTLARGADGLTVLEDRDDDTARDSFVRAMETLMAWTPPESEGSSPKVPSPEGTRPPSRKPRMVDRPEA